MRRAWTITAAGALTAAIAMLTATPAGADDTLPARHESAGHACGLAYSVWWEDGVLVSVGVQFDDPDHDGDILIEGVPFGPQHYMRTDGAVWMITHMIPDAAEVEIISGDCQIIVQGPSLAPPTSDPTAPLATRYAHGRILPTL